MIADVLGILKVSTRSLDFAYLENSARQRGVSDLLERAIGEAGLNLT